MERVQQVIHKIVVRKDLDKNVFDYVDSWDETPSYTVREIRDSYHRTLGSTPIQYLYGRNIIFNLDPIIYWQVITYKKQRKVGINNFFQI